MVTKEEGVERKRSPACLALLAGPFWAGADNQTYPNYPIKGPTPGVTYNVTAADVCQPGHAQNIRNVSQATKDKVYAEYDIKNPKPGDYEIDHFIPLEPGGSNDIKNLWPQPYQGTRNAHQKDQPP